MWACGSRLHDAGVQAERRFAVITDSLGTERDWEGGDCLWDRGSPCCDCGPRCGWELGTNRASSAASRRWPLLRTAGGNWDQEEGSAEVVDELAGLLGLLEDEAFSCWKTLGEGRADGGGRCGMRDLGIRGQDAREFRKVG